MVDSFSISIKLNDEEPDPCGCHFLQDRVKEFPGAGTWVCFICDRVHTWLIFVYGDEEE